MKRWMIVAQVRDHQVTGVLAGMETMFPDVQFRVGRRHRVVSTCELQRRDIKALLPTPHPNETARVVVEAAARLVDSLPNRVQP